MALSKVHTIQVSVPLTDNCTNDWYPVKGKSSDALPETLPHLMHSDSYADLSAKVRKRIRDEARKAGRVLSYSVTVSVEAEEGSEETATGVYLVATIKLK